MNEKTAPTAQVASLGKAMAEYGPLKRNVKLNKIAGIIVAVLAAALTVAGIVLAFRDTVWLYASLVGLFGLAIGLWSYRLGASQSGLRVKVFSEGLTHTKGPDTATYRWDDLKEIHQRIIRTRGQGGGTTHVYTIIDNDGRKATFDDKILNIQSLGQTLQQEVTKRLFPKALQACNAGETLPFGKLSLSKQGLTKGKKTLPWDQVESVDLKRGRVEIKKVGKRATWASVYASETPNLYVFMTLTKRILSAKEQRDIGE